MNTTWRKTTMAMKKPFEVFRVGAIVAVLVGLFTIAAGSHQLASPSASPISFIDIAKEAGLVHPTVYGGVDRKRFILETNGSGVALVDVDRDGWVDVFVLGGTRLAEGARLDASYTPADAPTNRLYRNTRDGRFEDVTDRAGLRRTSWSSSVCAGDYDNDGWIDLFVTSYGQNVLYRNRGDGRFTDATAAASLSTTATRWGSGCTFIDIDRDGRLDLFVANYLKFDLQTAPEPGSGINCTWKGLPVNCGPKGLSTDTNLLYRNEGNRKFVDVSEPSGISRVTGRYSMTALAVDLTDDGWTDIYVAADSTAAILYRNNHDGTFTDIAVESGTAYSEHGSPQAGMGVAAGDYNNDGRIDLAKTHFSDDIPALYRNLGKGLFEDSAVAAGLHVQNRYVQWGAGLADFDNDGFTDLMCVTGHVYPEIERSLEQYPHRGPRVLFRNRGDGRYEDVSAAGGPGVTTPHSSRGAAFGDIDNDGDIDVLVMNMNEPPSLLRNDYGGGNAWIDVVLRGRASNRSAIGATVIISAAGKRQARAVLSQASYYSHDDLRLHFGVGTATRVDEIEVRWPSGHVQRMKDVDTKKLITIEES
jgi:enediyne biosynthesis protein E4